MTIKTYPEMTILVLANLKHSDDFAKQYAFALIQELEEKVRNLEKGVQITDTLQKSGEENQ